VKEARVPLADENAGSWPSLIPVDLGGRMQRRAERVIDCGRNNVEVNIKSWLWSFDRKFR
jgi:hypothetical protein